MAFYGNPYSPYQYNPYQQQAYSQPQQIQQANGFISVRSIEEAFNWPIAPGNSLTFKDESAPYIYTKTKGFSQLEPPVFERFRLVKEESAQETPKKNPEPTQELPKEAFDAEGQIKALWDEIEAIKSRLEAPVKRRKAPKEEEPADDQ